MEKVNRRSFLRMASVAAGTTLVAACQPKVVEKIVKETVEVEKVVKETVVIEGTPQVVERTVVVEAPPKADDLPEVRYHESLRPQDEANGLRILAQFGEENGIKVKNEPLPENWPEKVLAMMAAGTAPDVQIGYGDPMNAFVARGMFVDIQPMIDRDLTQEQIDDYVQAQYDFFTYGQQGKRFALPKYCGTSAYLYNKGRFEEEGLPLPDNTWDWAQTVEIAQKLTKINSDGTYEYVGSDIVDLKHLGYVLAPFIWTWGGNVHDPNNNAICTMDEPKALEALQFAQDLRWKYNITGLPSDYESLKTLGWGLIATGRAAMHRGGSWHIPMALQSCDFAFDCMENPYAPGTTNRGTFLTTDGWGIWTGSKVIAESWELLKMLSASGIWGTYLLTSSWPSQPCKRSLAPDWVNHLKSSNPRLQDADIEVFVRAFDYAQPQVTFCNNPAALELIDPVLDQIYTLGSVQATDAIPPLVQEVNARLAKECPDGGW